MPLILALDVARELATALPPTHSATGARQIIRESRRGARNGSVPYFLGDGTGEPSRRAVIFLAAEAFEMDTCQPEEPSSIGTS